MKKFENYIIEKPCDSNSDKLQKILIIESLVDDILQFSLRVNNSVEELFFLQPFQKKYYPLVEDVSVESMLLTEKK
ncbi:TPA: hypothetical protein TT577_001117 [Streptococcus equi subsp. zooepidemicus]|nr:competence damage-inducible protein A [Streptococcus equi subsp. zooepidemicus Sz5]MCD3391460.1 hypothetical protein [Streptococcus equi subsp. zooepidemicus]MCD3393428.1 hypothetical protein [Streptococcus equi subsp. zooepidemicus]MCD3395984.1 hypothetical protein [Streptococcus equi subsp. zooepidemicus]MCD3408132.1 hypothetical protein [Streptococcus equi subsp. zooepidemicus]